MLLKCLVHSIILIDLVYKNDKNYYSHTLLEECKYKVWKINYVKKETIKRFITKALTDLKDLTRGRPKILDSFLKWPILA